MNNPLIIRPRRGTLNEWNDHKDIILRDRELVVIQNNDDIDAEPKFKLGDGVTPYKDLPYVSIHQAFKDGFIYTKGYESSMYPTIRIDYMHRCDNFNSDDLNKEEK